MHQHSRRAFFSGVLLSKAYRPRAHQQSTRRGEALNVKALRFSFHRPREVEHQQVNASGKIVLHARPFPLISSTLAALRWLISLAKNLHHLCLSKGLCVIWICRESSPFRHTCWHLM